MIETFAVDSTVSGVSSGYSVSTQNKKGYSGGFIGECISGRARDTQISNLKTVTASVASGKAGGFAGFAKAGDDEGAFSQFGIQQRRFMPRAIKHDVFVHLIAQQVEIVRHHNVGDFSHVFRT